MYKKMIPLLILTALLFSACKSQDTQTMQPHLDIEQTTANAEPYTSDGEQTVINIDIPEESPMSDRVTYQTGFYYESLSDNIKSRITGISYPEDCSIPYEDLRYVSILHYDLSGTECTGELICHQTIAQDLVEIFYELYQADYPIEKIKLIDEYNGDDESSMQDNNSSCFNYRVVEGTTRLSKHALGMAVDINPLYNPYVTYPDGVMQVAPADAKAYADRTSDFPCKITQEDLAYQLFTAHGFTWGGSWKSVKDYQHFEKALTQ